MSSDSFETRMKLNKFVFFVFLFIAIVLGSLILFAGWNVFSVVGQILGGLSTTVPIPVAIAAIIFLIIVFNTKYKDEGYY